MGVDHGWLCSVYDMMVHCTTSREFEDTSAILRLPGSQRSEAPNLHSSLEITHGRSSHIKLWKIGWRTPS
jgi:hypothetical protein